jgi:hypothetical protein
MKTTNDDARSCGSKKRARDGSDAGDGGGGQKQSLLPASTSTSESNCQVSSKSRPLSLLATCALDRGDIKNQQQLRSSPSDSVEGGNMGLFNHDSNSTRTIGHNIPPGDGLPTQNTLPLRGTNPPMVQMACIQPDGMLHRGQSHPNTAMFNPQYLFNYA